VLYLLATDDAAPSIPNANEIKAAKERRTKLRLNPNAEEFISLDGLSGTVKIRDAYDLDRGGPHPDSRLVREDDEEGDGADGESCKLPARHQINAD
jgi:GC-rich sequence DNA-binding factor